MTYQQRIDEENSKIVERKAKVGKYGEYNIMLNIAKEHSITVDEVYIMTVRQVYDLVERGKRLDYTRGAIEVLRKTQEPKP